MSAKRTAATAPVLRRITAEAVLQAFVAGGELTAGDLIAATGLSRPTVHSVCDELIGLGWVRETDAASAPAASLPATSGGQPAGIGPNAGGRPSRRYSLNAAAGFVAGIDLGATKISCCLADLRGQILVEATEPWRDEHVGAPERVMTARRIMRALLDEAGLKAGTVLAAGMAVPAPVTDDGHAVALESYLPGLASLDLRAALQPDFEWPLLVDNDANLAVLAERWCGSAQGVDNVVVLLAGERLGAGICLGGRLIRGNGAAGEMRFLELVEGVGNTDAVGGMCRELGAIAAAEILAGDRPETPVGSVLVELCGHRPEDVTAEMVVEAARRGEPAAVEVVAVVMERTARAAAVVSTLLDPELLVLAGGPAGSGDVLLPVFEQKLSQLNSARPRLAASTLGEHSALVGAVRMALDHALERLLA
ncbi:ROK family transcriptional regulator [Arthrobacter sp. ISL-65]|uniref:ROK family transcriptional regulator n=1 Tax=Arthrobacter sp. ISL-65 TaxID=2819112 RepID=UPI001BE8DC65|nr:ROK family transcriptional regulator [Arthrobacter sp. ISL-65]MBT2549008.1 ROK family transcriptional regulator [Arthrobacter sp. ISL-65]